MSSKYTLYYVPTLYWDGGYRVQVGSSGISSNINTCKVRSVADVDVKIHVAWLGSATMNILVEVTNNEATTYNGFLRVYVTEITSSMGWKGSTGVLCEFPFLDFALNTSIQLNPGEVYQTSMIWDGNQHNDGHGHTFGGITKDNTMVFAAVSDNTPHQGYSKPPSSAPFTAYYTDDVEAGVPQALGMDSFTLPLAGGTVGMNLFAGRTNHDRNYFLLGSATGTDPGLPLPGGMVTLPLVWDPFTDLTISLSNSAALQNFNGTLDNFGVATATLDTIGPVPPGALGVKMYYAFLLYYPTYFPYDFVSNPITIEVVP